jgi:hypothetical protein
MQHVNDLLAKPVMTVTDKPSPTTSTASKKTLALVWATLLNRRLVSEPVGSLQHKQFEADMADLTDEQLRRGLDRSKGFTGFLTLPVFRGLCQGTPSDHSLPDARSALLEAIAAPYPKAAHVWSHPAVYLAACDVGWWALERMTERELMPIWSAAYDQLVARVIAGESLALPTRRALPAQVHVPSTPETALANITKLKELLT